MSTQLKHLKTILLALAAFLVAALALPTATAGAAPAPSAPQVDIALAEDGKSFTLTANDGTFTTDDGTLTLRDADGETVQSAPLSGVTDGFVVPLTTTLSEDGTSVTVTPRISVAHRQVIETAAAKQQVAKKTKKCKTNNQCYNAMVKELNEGWKGDTPLFTLIGGLVGFIIWGFPGAAIGAGIGAYIGYQNSNPQAWPSVLRWINSF